MLDISSETKLLLDLINLEPGNLGHDKQESISLTFEGLEVKEPAYNCHG